MENKGYFLTCYSTGELGVSKANKLDVFQRIIGTDTMDVTGAYSLSQVTGVEMLVVYSKKSTGHENFIASALSAENIPGNACLLRKDLFEELTGKQ